MSEERLAEQIKRELKTWPRWSDHSVRQQWITNRLTKGIPGGDVYEPRCSASRACWLCRLWIVGEPIEVFADAFPRVILGFRSPPQPWREDALSTARRTVGGWLQKHAQKRLKL